MEKKATNIIHEQCMATYVFANFWSKMSLFVYSSNEMAYDQNLGGKVKHCLSIYQK